MKIMQRKFLLHLGFLRLQSFLPDPFPLGRVSGSLVGLFIPHPVEESSLLMKEIG